MFNIFKKTKTNSTQSSTSLKEYLAKSRQKLGSGLSTLLLGKKAINNDLLDKLEMLLISADIGINTTDEVLESVRKKASRKILKDSDGLHEFLKGELENLLIKDNQLNTNLKETYVILVVGVNGAGTKQQLLGSQNDMATIRLQNQGKSVMLAAGDTFRAAAVEQLKVWGERNNIAVVAQNTGADAASVIFDAYQSAQAKNIDIMIADTAGRLHTQSSLMQELEKIKRVITKQNEKAPHEVMLIIDGGAGQNALNQAKEFNKAVKLSGISITKLDGTAKGGIVFAIANELKLPIRYIGVGEGANDLKPFVAKSEAKRS